MSADTGRGGIGYVLKKFPVLSETFILNEILALEARGVPVHIFSLERPNDPRFHDDLPKLRARVAYLPDATEPERLWEYARRARRAFKQDFYRTAGYTLVSGRPTLVWRLLQSCYIANESRRLHLRHLHAHFASRPTSLAMLASRMTGLPFSFTPHATDIFKVQNDRRALRRKLQAARFVVAISEFNRSFLEELAGAGAPRFVRVNNGIDLTRFAPNGTAPRPPFVFISVARLVEKKGLPILIEACRRLNEAGIDFRCMIVGKGKLRPELERMIRAADLKARVELLGPKTQLEVAALYHQAHAYVLPCIVAADGNREGLPVSIVEALASGLPVLATPLTGIPEVVRHEENGLLCAERDAAELAAAMSRLVCDAALYERLRSRARASVADAFDQQRSAAVLDAAFTGAGE
jgi:colanic acid/amylovoran biosynthesis glycosyltransferase